MSKEIYISSTPHETRLAIVEDDGLTEIYYERENEYTLAGSIYNGKVTRVLPGMQSSFVDIGLERDAFLYITDFMEEAGDSADFDTNGDSHRSHNGEGRRNGSREALPEGASGKSEDSDRNRDRGARGRRDRGGRNRDRQPTEAVSPADPFEAPPVEATDTDHADHPETAPGEGAPGADSNRRWRGRRGRRRGRGPANTGSHEDSTQAASPETHSEEAADTSAETSYDTSYDESFDIDGAAAASPVADEPAETETSVYAQENSDRSGRGSRDGRGDRGSRGRGRDQRRSPRSSEPRTSSYGMASSAYDEAVSDGPAAEPIVLPGESLSKYRAPGDEPATMATAAPKADASVILPAAPEFSIPSGWDGGAVLPGETLSRRRAEPRTESPAPRSERKQAAQREPKPTAQSTIQPAVQAEYDPMEASASYRVDPSARSEFRQAAPVLEPEQPVTERETSP
ncbi:MAG: hypothetical protein ACRD3K_04490, partial [Edaphobacter sp.]